MKKQVVFLLVLAIALTMAPSAMAQCLRCRPVLLACGETSVGGWEYCEWTWDNQCIVQFPCSGFAPSEPEPLAAEFTVASVETKTERTEH